MFGQGSKNKRRQHPDTATSPPQKTGGGNEGGAIMAHTAYWAIMCEKKCSVVTKMSILATPRHDLCPVITVSFLVAGTVFAEAVEDCSSTTL